MKHCQTPTPPSTWRRRWTTYLFALTGACLAILPQGLYAYDNLSSAVPDAIKVPAGHRPFLRGDAVGTQNYICLPSVSSVSGVAWTLVGPQATLFNSSGAQIITHFFSLNPEEESIARATWQDSRDTSAVWARLKQEDATVVVQPGAIPWLLLKVVGAVSGSTGGERLTETTYIQRVRTTGGLAPATGCGEASNVGAREFVPYTADYIFYKATGE